MKVQVTVKMYYTREETVVIDVDNPNNREKVDSTAFAEVCEYDHSLSNQNLEYTEVIDGPHILSGTKENERDNAALS